MNFKEFLNEAAGPKVKKIELFNLPAKMYTTTLPICREVHEEMGQIIDFLEKGYYGLGQDKWNVTTLISPEDLAKIPGALDALKAGDAVKIGRGKFRMPDDVLDEISNKAFLLTVEGEIKETPIKNTNIDNYWWNAKVIRGIGLNRLTQGIAQAHSDNGMFGAYFTKSHKSVRILGGERTLDLNKPFITFATQHAFRVWTYFKPKDLEYVRMPIGKLFPAAFKKSTIDKERLFVIK